MRTVYLVLISTLCFALLITGCSKEESETSTSTTSTTSSSSTSEFLVAIPSNLAVSSNTTSGSSVSSRTLGRTAQAVSDTTDPVSQKDKVTRLQAVLNSTSLDECHKAIPKTMKYSGGKYVDCYGPELAYVNHPNWEGTTTSFSRDNSSLPTGDLGIWTAYNDNTTQEACAAGQMNLLMKKISKKVDLAMGISAMLVCAAKNDGLSLPAVGASALAVTDSLNKTKMGDERGGMSITSATIQRTSLTSGKTLWTSSLVGSFTATGDTSSQAFSITLKHVPTTEGTTVSTAGEGLIQMYQTGLSENDNNCGGTTLSLANSVLYKNTSDNLSFRAIRAKFPSTISDASYFYESSDGELRKKNKNDNSTSGWCADYNVVVANVDSSGFGKVSYAWQAGPMDGYTRTFNIKTDNTSGTLTGDAYFGFNPNPDDSSGSNDYRSTSIDRMICNWAGPGSGPTSKTGVSKLQRQQLTYDSTNYVWKSTTDNITFAPTTNCDFSTSDNRSYDNLSQSNTTFGGSGDNITSNLESISNYTTNYGSQPSAPTVTLE